MNYAVIWTKKAADQLAQAWLDATDRTAVQRASNLIDTLLATDPRAHGESRRGNDRLFYEPPLAVYYRVDDSDRKVFVLSVKLI
jgi:mRNA-degrading endonuclease RelE of RelBE toxin-antitoxin system